MYSDGEVWREERHGDCRRKQNEVCYREARTGETPCVEASIGRILRAKGKDVFLPSHQADTGCYEEAKIRESQHVL